MVARRKMDNRFGPGERCRQPIPGTDIASVQWNIRRTAFDPRFDGSLHVVPCLRQRRDDMRSDKTGTTRYDNPQRIASGKVPFESSIIHVSKISKSLSLLKCVVTGCT